MALPLHYTAAQLGPAVVQALEYFRSPEPVTARYALLPALGPLVKPVVFDTAGGLARRIHRSRGADALRLRDARVRFKDQERRLVEVLAEDIGERTRRIGFAWLNGADWRALEAALAAETPTACVEN